MKSRLLWLWYRYVRHNLRMPWIRRERRLREAAERLMGP